MSVETNFLVQCYFGDVSDPILSAIDKAYLDMQAHTISGDKENCIFPNRRKVTEIIYKAIEKLPKEKDYNIWHKNLAYKIKETYDLISYGQIQKWINMTTKYVYTLKQLDIDGIDDYFCYENAKLFHPPLDSFVIRSLNLDYKINWSQIESYEDYLKIVKKISFFEEYEKWPLFVNESKYTKEGTERKAAKGTYKEYIQKHEYEYIKKK